jgi:hypothetical protein
MARLISILIEKSKLENAKTVTLKNGKEYYDATIAVNDQPNDYGQDVQMYEGQSKEEREAKSAKKFLGSGKTFWSSEAKKDSSPF